MDRVRATNAQTDGQETKWIWHVKQRRQDLQSNECKVPGRCSKVRFDHLLRNTTGQPTLKRREKAGHRQEDR